MAELEWIFRYHWMLYLLHKILRHMKVFYFIAFSQTRVLSKRWMSKFIVQISLYISAWYIHFWNSHKRMAQGDHLTSRNRSFVTWIDNDPHIQTECKSNNKLTSNIHEQVSLRFPKYCCQNDGHSIPLQIRTQLPLYDFSGVGIYPIGGRRES